MKELMRHASSAIWLVILSVIVFAGCGAKSDKYPAVELISATSAVDVAPRLIHFEEPVYPELARLAMVEDVVEVEALVDKVGVPHNAVAVSDVKNSSEFQESAEEAALKCRFRPAMKDGSPVEATIRMTFEFKVSPEERRKDAYRRRMGA